MSESDKLIRNVIDSICYQCAKRMFHFQLFTFTSTSTKYDWIAEMLNEKKKIETSIDYIPVGCGVCFGLLEKFSQEPFLKDFAAQVHANEIQFKDFRISLTSPNNMIVREKFIQLVLDSIPSEDYSLRIYNPSCLTVKEQWKILTFRPLESIMEKPYFHTGPFDVKIRFTIDDIEADNKLLETLPEPLPEGKPKRLSKKARIQKEVQEKGFTKPNVDRLIFETSLETMKKFYQLPFKRVLCSYQIECSHDPIYLAGRYQKYSRTLSQTAWLIEDEEGKKRVKTSIEEIMGNVLKRELSAKEFVFTASGREDIDVKCLGDGRPFILEFFEPKRTEFTKQELKHYQKLINESTDEMAVKDLQYITREQTKLIKEGQEDKTKGYSALCYCYSKLNENDMKKLNDVEKVEIFQKTPIRVLHRRTVLTRPRTITKIKAELIDEHHFRIKMTTQAGTYVKEFVHGDLGRTWPSLCTILDKECDIIELDVEAVNLDFPPVINSDNEDKN